MSRSFPANVGSLAPLLLLLAAAPLGGADPAPLRYRRVFVPQADIDQQIRGLLPLKRDEFERRVERAAALAQGTSRPEQVQVTQAVYRARLEDSVLVDGRAELTIDLRRELPALLSLSPCNLALGNAAWNDSPPRPAQLGTSPDGQLACVVTKPGQLQFDWSLAGKSDGRGNPTFLLQLPPAPINRLEIELPAGARLAADRGLAAPANPAGQKNLWLVEAGAAREITLQVSRSSPEASGQPLVLVHETTAYSVQRATIDVETSLQLDVLQQPLARLRLLVDEPLQLTQVRLGEQILPVAPLPELDGRQQVEVSLPEPLQGEGIVVRLSGVASWSGAGRQVLPRVRLAGGEWQDGRATVAAPAALQLVAAPQGGCWQTAFSPSTPLRLDEQWQFQYYLPDAAVQIEAAATAAPLSESSGISLDFQAAQVQATLIAELSAVTAPRFEVEAQIPRAWIVDAIEVQPADMLEDRMLQTRGGGPQRLRLALRRPIAAGRPLTVVIRAHRRRPPVGQAVPGDFGVLARFATVREARRLVELRSTDPAARVLLAGDEDLPRIDPQSLSPSQLKLFEAPPGPLVFELDQRADALQIRLAAASPRYRADTFVRAEAHKDQLRQICRLRITPEESLLESVTVRFSPPPPEPIQWSIAGESSREVAVQRIQPPAALVDEAVYEVKLQRPRRTTFDLVAQFDSAENAAANAVSLASVPAASSQTGLVEVHAASAISLAIEAPELQAIPPPSRAGKEAATIRGAYRYDPGRAGSLLVSLLHGRGLPLAWIESLEGTSRILADGSGDHEARLVVRNPGQGPLVVVLPPSAANLRAEIDGQLRSGNVIAGKADEYVLQLPPGAPSVRLRLTYSSPPAVGNWRPWGFQAAVPLPRFRLPVQLSSWQVQLPPGLEPAGTEIADSPIRAAGLPWSPGLLFTRARTSSQELPMTAPSPDASESGGWTTCALAYGSQPVAEIQIVRPAVMQLWGWCLALAVAALVFYSAPAMGRLAGLALAAAALCLLVPREIAPLAAGVLVGLALGAAAGLLRPGAGSSFVRAARPLGSRAQSSFLARPTLLLLLLAGLAGLAPSATGQQPGRPAPLRRVVIPVDDARQPVGDYVFLEPELYDALLQLTDRDPSGMPEWLVHSARYQPSLAPQSESPTPLESIAAEFEIETFAAEATIELAFAREQIHLIEGRARLNGKPLLTQWSAEGRLTFAVPRPGKQRVELSFVPSAAPREGILCDVQIPAVASSRLVLAGDAELEAVGGHNQSPDASGQRVTQLGAAGRLTLHFAAARGPRDAAPIVAGDQLVCWKVRPGSVTAEGEFRIRPIGGQTSEITIELDSRLRLLPLPADSPVARHWIEPLPGGSRLHLVLDEPATAQTTIQASFLWTGATGIGNFSLPKIALACDKPGGDWAAVSLGGGLAWKTAPSGREPMDAELPAPWRESLPADAIVLAGASRTAISLSTEPERTRIKAIERLSCSASTRSLAVQYTARLANVPPHALLHRVRVSPGMQVTRLSVSDGERTIRAQWSQGADQALVVQLMQPPPAEMEITLEGRSSLGRLPATPALPLAQYVGAAEDELLVTVHQQSGVQVAAPQSDANWKEEDDPDIGRFREGLGRSVGTLRRIGGPVSAAPRAAVAASSRDLGGLILSRLVRGDGGWQLEVECLLTVESGLLETLRLELPPGLTGPLEIVPAAEHELAAVPGQAAQRLLIRPQRALDDAWRLVIRGPLRALSDQAAIGLDATVIDAPRVRRLVALPRRAGDQRYQWETSGLQAVDPATVELPASALPPGYELFEAVADRPAARPRPGRRSSPAARVLLAQHELRLGSGRRVSGASTFDVAPGGAGRFTLAVPPGCRLVHASVEGMPAQVVPRGAGQWSIEAVSERATQRLEVVYDGAVGVGAAAEVAVPQLVDLPPERSLWSVAGQQVVAVRQDSRFVKGDRHEHQLVLLESLAAAIDAMSTTSARDLPESVLLESLGAWHERFHSAQALLDPDLPPPLSERAAIAKLTVQHALDRLLENGLAVPPGRAIAPAATDETWQWQWVALDPGSSIEVVTARPPGGASDVRLAGALGLAAMGLLAILILGHSAVQTWLTQHAHFAVALLGCLLLAAGVVPWLGAIVVFLALWRAVHSAWLWRQAEVPSTILQRRS